MQDKAWTEGFLPRGMALIRRQESRLMRLVESSQTFDAVAADASRQHDGRDATSPMLAPSWVTLQIATDVPAASPTQLATWRIVGGDGVGMLATANLWPSAEGVVLAESGNGGFEICRPTSFSPLR
jgi:hypothetical protein